MRSVHGSAYTRIHTLQVSAWLIKLAMIAQSVSNGAHSPFLFNLAAECLTKMMTSAQKNGLVKGLASDLIEDGVGILQYADDIVIYFENDR